jgi:predicted amidohydrolase YtcJ
LGSIEEGKMADLVVLENDILTCPLDEIRDARVRMTIMGGKIVYQA